MFFCPNVLIARCYNTVANSKANIYLYVFMILFPKSVTISSLLYLIYHCEASGLLNM